MYKMILGILGVFTLSIACMGENHHDVSNTKSNEISFLDYMQITLDSHGIRYVYLDTSWTFNTKYYTNSEVDLYNLKDSIYQSAIDYNPEEVIGSRETLEWISKTEFEALDILRLKRHYMQYCDSNYAVLGAPIFINEDASLLITYFNTYFFCEHNSKTTLPLVYQYQPKDSIWKLIDTFTIPVSIQPPMLN